MQHLQEPITTVTRAASLAIRSIKFLITAAVTATIITAAAVRPATGLTPLRHQHLLPLHQAAAVHQEAAHQGLQGVEKTDNYFIKKIAG